MNMFLFFFQVLFIYPAFRNRGFSDMALCFAALIIKIFNLLAVGFVFSTAFAFFLSIFATFNRFIPTALRATASQAVEVFEQGFFP